MSDPGVGTPVIYHDGTTGADLPGVVVVTHDSWTESMADPEVWNIDQPDEGSPYILTFGYFGDSVASPSGRRYRLRRLQSPSIRSSINSML